MWESHEYNNKDWWDFFLLNQSVVKYQVFVSVHQNRRVMLSLETLHLIMTFISKREQPNHQKRKKKLVLYVSGDHELCWNLIFDMLKLYISLRLNFLLCYSHDWNKFRHKNTCLWLKRYHVFFLKYVVLSPQTQLETLTGGRFVQNIRFWCHNDKMSQRSLKWAGGEVTQQNLKEMRSYTFYCGDNLMQKQEETNTNWWNNKSNVV